MCHKQRVASGAAQKIQAHLIFEGSCVLTIFCPLPVFPGNVILEGEGVRNGRRDERHQTKGTGGEVDKQPGISECAGFPSLGSKNISKEKSSQGNLTLLYIYI